MKRIKLFTGKLYRHTKSRIDFQRRFPENVPVPYPQAIRNLWRNVGSQIRDDRAKASQ